MNKYYIHEYKIGDKKVRSIEEHPCNIQYWNNFQNGLYKAGHKPIIFIDKNGRFISMFVRRKDGEIDRYYKFKNKVSTR